MKIFRQGDIVKLKEDGKGLNFFEVICMYKPFPHYETQVACAKLSDPRPIGDKEVYYLPIEDVELVEGFLNEPVGEKGVSGDKLVTHPDHYTAGGIETRDYIKAKLNAMPFLTPWQAYCLGTAMKYQPRAGLKNRDTFTQDLEKSITYTKWAFEDEKV